MKKYCKLFIATLFLSAGVSAFADGWGCKVFLCLADPRGATTEEECASTIAKLNRDLARGKPFPTCDTNDAGSFARPVFDYFDPCPEGTVPFDGLVLQSDGGTWREWRNSDNQISHSTGDGTRMMETITNRACVSGYKGSFQDGHDGPTVKVYGTIIWQEPQPPRAFDVFVNGKLWQRSRP